ncbi:tRNA (5-methylaminomethyl-2-thiouridine)(34)-methyltransferase MnmD [Parvularcula lutaonensis]|uniref:tRNA 5-methylaminomethyl-2-thiouridine biosynthesis bifunctional protein MnmC n=1 Tax=Parvularcula lutaonensis TaxID=491923 RepID=A0ABV7MDZ6_9PROT|nr:tRNA (5-methylaminomethyl-2-thiouridine)(34)-methyltransferase MnmD [Parvularcula lutaonensis]GGY54208.1 tRNA 5-methylaminomethyl-2-thiouridine biosynthesis bifunctional protein MnmC [Parvularcula lutaonensis]
MSRLGEPELEEGEAGTLRSLSFGDIYYSPEDGLAESRYVFVDGNDLHRRLESVERGQDFVVGELGFGTGLNVLALWQACAEVRSGPLHIWSCEAFPLHKDRFVEMQRRIAERWPELRPYADRLAALYPEPCPGTVRLDLAPHISLTIAFGEAEKALAAADFKADAWFLDGFAPSRNPAMWSPAVMAQLARLSKSGATAATFSVAGGVRAALEGAGFAWEKAPGFGRKKHMLRARIDEPNGEPSENPWFAAPGPVPAGKVAIIGGGIAGAHLAHALHAHDREAVLFDPQPAGGASGNPAGLVMPRLDADDSPAARFYRDAFLHAVRTYRIMPEAFTPCGGEMAIDDAKAEGIASHGLWPDGALEFHGGRALVRDAGVLRPEVAVRTLMAGVQQIANTVVSIHQEDASFVETANGERHGPFAAVIDARGAAHQATQADAVMPSLGQIDVFDGPCLDRIVTDGSYVAPLGSQLIAGATYAAFAGGEVGPSAENTEANRASAAALLGRPVGNHVSSRAALRATTQDRHPMAGPLYDTGRAIHAYRGLAKGSRQDYPPAPYRKGRYVLTGLGSRGLVTAPILAAHVAAQLCGGVSPLTRDAADMVHPGRFLVRAIKRGKVSP